MIVKLSYGERADKHWQGNGAKEMAREFLKLMERKKSNLCVSADKTTAQAVIDLADLVGPHICMLKVLFVRALTLAYTKTHVDIISDFTPDFCWRLIELADKHDFMIFEDRKFADIGNTVVSQYAGGVFKISSWSHITNAHPIPGDGIVQGLAKIGLSAGNTFEGDIGRHLNLPRGLLLLAEMSSKGALAVGEYTQGTVDMACRNTDFCIGFVGSRRFEYPDNVDFLCFTPGVQLEEGVDDLGQQYRTVSSVVANGSDCIIVGRGVYGAVDVADSASEYQRAGWLAYEARIAK